SARQPVTINRRQAPPALCCAISRIVSIDSCFAESMNAHVLTTSTSAAVASFVSSWPASRASPSITSESTRFLGQPNETSPIFMAFAVLRSPFCVLRSRQERRTENGEPRTSSSRVQPVQHSRIWNRLAQVIELADPRHHSFDAHPEPAVWHGAVAAQVEIPLEGLLRQLVLLDSLQEQIKI